METTVLPGIERPVSRLGLGCGALGCPDHGAVDESLAAAAVSRALEQGTNLFDTADVYGLGKAEQVLGDVLGAQREHVTIVSKFGVTWEQAATGGRARTYRDASPEHVVRALEGSLRRLRLDRIPLYLVHWPDDKTPLAQTMAALDRCRRQGKIGQVGVSNFSAAQVREAHAEVPLAAVEIPYSLVDRTAEAELLPLCRELRIGCLAYAPLAQGLLTGKYNSQSEFEAADRRRGLAHFRPEAWDRHASLLARLEQVAAASGKSPGQVAIRWVLDNPAVSTVLVGAKSPAQQDENAGALGWELSSAAYRYLADGLT